AAEMYAEDEWAWVRTVYEQRAGRSVDTLTAGDIDAMRAEHAKLKASLIKKILLDAEKEFDETAQMGFGADGTDADRASDFEAVRGTFPGNSFVKKMNEELEKLIAVRV